MIKAIFFDIDGTLISQKHPRMKPDTIQTLKRLRNKGIRLFVASGRHTLEIEELKLDEDFHFDGYLLLNGGYCFNDDELIYENKIDNDDVKEICRVIDKNQYATLFIEKEDMYVNFINEKVICAQNSINTSIPRVSSKINYDAIIQIDPYVCENDLKEIVRNTHHCKWTKWHDEAYDIISATGGKKAGIEAMMKYYGLQKEELAAFGDGENDIEMFAAVGVAIAMGNASKKVKAKATRVCDDVDGGGISSIMEQLGL